MHANDLDAEYFENAHDGTGPDIVAELDMATFQALMAARQAQVSADAALIAAVNSARAHGTTWAAIGAALGISRQAAHAKFAPRTE